MAPGRGLICALVSPAPSWPLAAAILTDVAPGRAEGKPIPPPRYRPVIYQTVP